MNKNFFIAKIDEKIFSRIDGKSYKKNCTLPIEDLRYLQVLHKNLTGETLTGEIICNVHISEILLEIFKKLYEKNYPIEKIRLVDEYNADDELSMSDNNSSSFNFRLVARKKIFSKHAAGLAVDINPLYNPYITTVDGKKNVEPANAKNYVDREKNFPYKIDENDFCYKIFAENGFEWGGSWTHCKDYQHFELPDEFAKKFYPTWRFSDDQ